MFFLLISIHSFPAPPFSPPAQFLLDIQDRPGTSSSKSESRSVVSDSLWPHGQYSPWNSPGQNTGGGSLSLLQGILPNPGMEVLLHCRWILYQLSHKGSSRILEWVAYPFSSRYPNSGIEPESPALQVILYQLSYQGSPPPKSLPQFSGLSLPPPQVKPALYSLHTNLAVCLSPLQVHEHLYSLLILVCYV